MRFRVYARYIPNPIRTRRDGRALPEPADPTRERGDVGGDWLDPTPERLR